jgi:hypothetical protein
MSTHLKLSAQSLAAAALALAPVAGGLGQPAAAHAPAAA